VNILSKIHPELKNRILWVQRVAKSYYGISSSITSGYRTFEQQKRLWEHPQGYPVSPPGCTSHELGVAVDLVASGPKSNQSVLMEIAKSVGLSTYQQDPIHFTLFSPQQIEQIKTQYCR
jgi:hypothetical protein